MSGEKGFLSVRYVGGGTSPFAQLERVTLTRGGKETDVEVERGEPGFTAILRDFANSIEEGRRPVAPGIAGARALEATLAAYAAAAWQETVGLPLSRDSAVYTAGVQGITRGQREAQGPLDGDEQALRERERQ